MSAPSPRKIVLAPNLIAAAFIDPAARRVLEAWRDGKFLVAMNRELIALHLRALTRVALAPRLIKRWACWLTSPEKTVFLDKEFQSQSVVNTCEAVAKFAHGEAIICWKLPKDCNDGPWILACEFHV